MRSHYPDSVPTQSVFLRIKRFATTLGMTLLIGATMSPAMGRTQRSVASSNLRQVGQACLIYASEHQEKLPATVATDVWDFARLTALEGGLNDATIWANSSDPATQDLDGHLSTVLTKDRSSLDPNFRKLKPTWAVALGDIHAGSPATTPIAWTRGLQPDGTWPAHGPNGTDGGHLVFLGGNVAFYRNTRDAFTRFDGKGPCTDIRDALPPGTRIAQYEPNAEEQAAWARTKRIQYVTSRVTPMILPSLWLVAGVVLLVQAVRRRWPFSWCLWYLVFSLIAAIIIPTVS